MMRLEQHIQQLLLDNDCVIIPGIGGFIVHDIAARYDETQKLFIPPARTIGFNTKLTVNDGLLVHAVMKENHIAYEEATATVQRMCGELKHRLYETGEYILPQVGMLRMNIRGGLEFESEAQIADPAQWGFLPFHMEELSALTLTEKAEKTEKTEKEPHTVRVSRTRKMYEIHVNRSFIHSTLAVAASIILLFVLSTPIKNTYVEKDNYAQLMPMDLFERIEYRSMNVTPIKKATVRHSNTKSETPATDSLYKKIKVKEVKVGPEANIRKPQAAPQTVQTVKAEKPQAAAQPAQTAKAEKPQAAAQPAQTAKAEKPQAAAQPAQTVKTTSKPGPFHIIVAGGIAEETADKAIRKLQAEGYTDVRKLQAPGNKFRVSLCSFNSRPAAEAELEQLRKTTSFKDAWLLVNK